MHKATLKIGVAAVLSTLAFGVYAAEEDVAAAADAGVTPNAGAVIVTGTRSSGIKVENSASPIQVLDAASLQRTGQPDLIQALAQNLPSFTAQAFGGDTANLTLSARLRGLSPNNTLVLINGKRRHGTSNLAVLGGPYQGGAAADLNYIPVSAIDHIEVLQDGAAAQYGSDAIAGVVNIILKSNNHGGTATATGGGYVDGGGRTADASANIGLEPFADAYLSLTAESKYHGYSDRGGLDPRVVNPANMAAYPGMFQHPGYPHVNHIAGDAQYHLNVMTANFGYDFAPDSQFYTIFTAGRKEARAFENYRLPSRLPKIYPTGFSPKETMKQDDFGLTVGIKGKLAGWNTDLSTTYGRDKAQIGVADSGNVSLFNDTGATPTVFKAGAFIASQLTTTLETSKEFEIGWAKPLNVAAGLEHRIDKYEIEAGDAASRYKEGSQSYPGFSLTDAGSHRRTNKAAYIDVAGNPVADLTVDVAARYEHFSDFGNAKVGKLTSRYDFSPAVGLRGTFSNGFRAPTLAEEYYSATNVGPTTAFVQLAPNSAGAKLVGVDGLKPEKSTNLSLGLVLNPVKDVAITLDVYQIKIRDRIVGSGSLYGSGGAVNSPAVTAAIKANGNVLDSTVSQTGINIFSNAVDTRSRGLEFVTTINSNYGTSGKVDWSIAANYNKVEVTKINQAPTQLLPQTLLDKTAISDLETASPKLRVNLGALWKVGNWTVNLREAIYGKASEYGSEDGAVYHLTEVKPKLITDLEVGYKISNAWSVAVGANNLFNIYPNGVNPNLLADQRAAGDNAAVNVLPSFSPFGINGGYYYARANYKF
ncbi:iron complex outermembrane recepter protein [Duganella sp. CF402]|uniref:TonB-dependent receptor plug domain-containing protein n=1 Tax=unclassified Duganella TaxID=2636909 RepID=UPI0008C108D3|nr:MULTISPECIES: TonB-dependent receptor [unclassified Duganella]RZT06201.1 iron complex outermembrane receptor protein [Duganella sp. BK701]SEM72317.1 iron complex outermembrane recepter protein [Duganella sp. CF402]